MTPYRVLYVAGKARIVWATSASVYAVAALYGAVLAIEERAKKNPPRQVGSS